MRSAVTDASERMTLMGNINNPEIDTGENWLARIVGGVEIEVSDRSARREHDSDKVGDFVFTGVPVRRSWPRSSAQAAARGAAACPSSECLTRLPSRTG
jgi:hypothetical protein